MKVSPGFKRFKRPRFPLCIFSFRWVRLSPGDDHLSLHRCRFLFPPGKEGETFLPPFAELWGSFPLLPLARFGEGPSFLLDQLGELQGGLGGRWVAFPSPPLSSLPPASPRFRPLPALDDRSLPPLLQHSEKKSSGFLFEGQECPPSPHWLPPSPGEWADFSPLSFSPLEKVSRPSVGNLAYL